MDIHIINIYIHHNNSKMFFYAQTIIILLPENEYNKRLDLEIKFPDKDDYDDSLYLSSDQDYENEMNYMNPVPYIIINSMDTGFLFLFSK